MAPPSPLVPCPPPLPPRRRLLAALLLVSLAIGRTDAIGARNAQQKPPLVARQVTERLRSPSASPSSPRLSSAPSLSFKVLQLADLHFTGDPLWPCKDAPWELPPRYAHEPCNEALMAKFVDELLDLEQPDLVVFSGDNVQTFDPAFHQRAVDAFMQGVEARGIPHAEILGNHDDDYGFPRERVLRLGMQKRFSYTQRGPRDRGVDGVGNYQLSVVAPADGPWGKRGESVFHMYFLDSGGRLDTDKYPNVKSRYDWIHDSQVAYYQELSRANKEQQQRAATTEPLPAIMFFHIPLREYLHASIQYWRRTGAMNEKVEPSDIHSKLFRALVDAGEVKATFAGHDHTNAYCYLREGIQLCTGGGAGLGVAYSDPEFVRRARVIEWRVNNENERTITSWKRMFGASNLEDKVDEEVLFTQSEGVRVGLLEPENASSSLVVIPHLCAFVVLLLMLAAICAAKVLVVLSTCLSPASRTAIDMWLDNLKNREMVFVQGEAAAKIEYDYRVLQDTLSCGAIDPTQNLARMTAAEFTKYSGLLSFVTNPRSMNTLEYAADRIGYAAKFQVCEPSLDGADEDRGCKKDPTYIYLGDIFNELPKFSPFRQMVSKFYCSATKRSVAYSELDADGTTRTCTCDCPPGMELRAETSSCKPIAESVADCTWLSSAIGSIATVEITPANTKLSLSTGCSINKLLTGLGLALPTLSPVTRSHEDDGVTDYATLIASTVIGTDISRASANVLRTGGDPVNEAARAVPGKKYTWSDYLSSPSTTLDRITLPGYGNYYVTLYANDYRSSGRCAGTLTAVDKFRPIGDSAKCASAASAATAAVIPTAQRIATLNNEVNSVYTFKRSATNDPCSVTSNNRCDVDSLALKKFVDSSTTSGADFATGEGFFALALVGNDLVAKLKAASTAPPADPAYACTRCARAATTLKEWWTEYQGSSVAANQTCDGTSACVVSRCLKVAGPSLVAASVKIEGGLKLRSADAAAKLLAANPGQAYPLDDATIYLPLDCSDYLDSAPTAAPYTCAYANKVAKMFTMAAAATKDSIIQTAASYARWEYQIDGGDWKKLSSTAVTEVFFSPSTAVTIRAWTNCGVVIQKTFYVKLYVNSAVHICDSFPDMWTQTAKTEFAAPPQGDLCLLPKSNFADLGFAFDPAKIAITQQPDTFKMEVTSVQCQLQYDIRAPVVVINPTGASMLPSQLAIARNFALTVTATPATVTAACNFMYTRPPILGTATSTSVIGCSQDFTVRDCMDAVSVAPSLADAMCAKKCVASTSTANLYESCGGDRISASKTKTLLSQSDRTCCDSCKTGGGYQTQCNSIAPPGVNPNLQVFGYNEIERCEPALIAAAVLPPPPLAPEP